MQGFVRLSKTGESGILVVYKTIRRMPSDRGESGKSAKAAFGLQVVRDAIGADDIKVDLVTGEDWTAKCEAADRIS